MSQAAKSDVLKEHLRAIDRKSYAKHRDRRNEAGRKWRADNPEKVREIKKRWRAANPDKVAEDRLRRPTKPRSLEARRLTHRKSRYGVTPEIYDAMLADQGHSCKICSKKPKAGKTLTVDVAIGNLGDNEAGLLRALAYLRQGTASSS